MLELTEVAKWLTDRLNEKGLLNTPIYSFNINAEVGKNKGENVVNGILISETPKMTPIADIKDYKYKLRVTLSVTAPTGNFNLKNVENIVGAVAEDYNGKSIDFTNGKGITTFTLTGTKDFKIDAGQGGIVPITFYLDITYTEGLITSVNKVWKLNGYTIPFLSESVIIEKNGKINPINDRKYQQVFMTTQLKWYHFRFPFVDNELCNMLYKDLLEGDMNKRYTLTYYDGVNYTEANPYETKVVIFRNGDADSQKPDTALFDIMFSDADDGKNKTKYELALIDNAFDGSTENTRWFDSEEEQRLWYDTKIKILTPSTYNEIPAPNLNSLILTNQVYQNTSYFDYGISTYSNAVAQGYYYRVGYDKYGYTYDLVANITEEEFNTYISGGGICYYEVHLSVFDLTNRNYAVIRVSTEDFYRFNKPATRLSAVQLELFYQTAGQYKPVSELTDAQYASLTYVYTNKRYFYYRVANANIGANNQVIYDLQLDEVQTYLFQSNINIQGSFISKAHLDRWLYSYELVNATVLEKPSQADCLTYGYYKKTPDNNTIGSGDTFELITISNYALTNYVYEMVLTFNYNADSKLFEREDLRELPKRLLDRKKLSYDLSIDYKNDSNFTEVDPKPEYRFFNNNARGLYYKPHDTYILIPEDITEADYDNISSVYECPKKWVEDGLTKIPMWVYVYFVHNADTKYKVKNTSNTNVEVEMDTIKFLDLRRYLHDYTTNDYSDIDLPYSVLCYPLVYGGSDQIYEVCVKDYYDANISRNHLLKINSNGYQGFLDENEGFIAEVVSVKVSTKPPFDIKRLSNYNYTSEKSSIKFDPDNALANVLNIGGSTYSKLTIKAIRTKAMLDTNATTRYDGLFLLDIDYSDSVPLKVSEQLMEKSFKKQELVNVSRNKKFNPKLNSGDYKQLNITFAGNTFEFPLDKMGVDVPRFEYFEELKPDITKGLLRYETETNEFIFNEAYSNSFNGFTYQNDFNIGIKVDKYQDYIANNKNAYAQLNAQLSYNEETAKLTNKYGMIKGAISGGTSILGGVGGLVAGDFGKGAQQIASGISGVTNAAISAVENLDRVELSNNYEKTKFDYSIDNMKNAPSSLKNLTGSAILSHMIDKFGIYAEIFEGLDTELESANDVMFRDGYNLNRFEESGTSVKDYCHTRKYFNYVRATLGNISGIPMSDKMRSALRQRFANGIRFWHQDTIDYSKENYELKIEQ